MGSGVFTGAPIHGFHEGFSEVGGVQCNEVEISSDDAIEDALSIFIGDVVMADMSPPDQDIGPVEVLVGEALIGIIEGDGADVEFGIGEGLELGGDFVAEKIFVGFFLPGLSFVPDKDVNGGVVSGGKVDCERECGGCEAE